jgi:hypothetical protein
MLKNQINSYKSSLSIFLKIFPNSEILTQTDEEFYIEISQNLQDMLTAYKNEKSYKKINAPNPFIINNICTQNFYPSTDPLSEVINMHYPK